MNGEVVNVGVRVRRERARRRGVDGVVEVVRVRMEDDIRG